MPKTAYGITNGDDQHYRRWYDNCKVSNKQINEDWARISSFLPYIQGNVYEGGCQTGGVTKILAKYAKRVVSIDVSQWNVDQTRLLLTELGLIHKVELHTGFIEHFKTDEKFDAVALFEIIEHVRDDRGLVGQAISLLKPGGYLLSSIPYEHRYQEEDHLNYYTLKDIHALFGGWNCKYWVTIACEPEMMWFLVRLKNESWNA